VGCIGQCGLSVRLRATKTNNAAIISGVFAGLFSRSDRNHNPRVGGSSPSSGIVVFAGNGPFLQEIRDAPKGARAATNVEEREAPTLAATLRCAVDATNNNLADEPEPTANVDQEKADAIARQVDLGPSA
jgi:hypothetical protein